VTDSENDFNHSPEHQTTRLAHLLDRSDAGIALMWRKIWRFLIDGFAVCGQAEWGFPVDVLFDGLGEQECNPVSQPPPRRPRKAFDGADRRGDFKDIHTLIASIRAMDKIDLARGLTSQRRTEHFPRDES
jgi:hypothetical protein